MKTLLKFDDGVEREVEIGSHIYVVWHSSTISGFKSHFYHDYEEAREDYQQLKTRPDTNDCVLEVFETIGTIGGFTV